ncbi:hypothetical protein CEXT_781981 [Caerostris extrusa]|uniref:Uncharacterized protein n=1 Tax=Caerostris extrusa TaxID=172846 RepID=A0AAV4VFJ4_CAEEX|nr:hypothetical protein CEXT_781981 [Caerostris extrusa]
MNKTCRNLHRMARNYSCFYLTRLTDTPFSKETKNFQKANINSDVIEYNGGAFSPLSCAILVHLAIKAELQMRVNLSIASPQVIATARTSGTLYAVRPHREGIG